MKPRLQCFEIDTVGSSAKALISVGRGESVKISVPLELEKDQTIAELQEAGKKVLLSALQGAQAALTD